MSAEETASWRPAGESAIAPLRVSSAVARRASVKRVRLDGRRAHNTHTRASRRLRAHALTVLQVSVAKRCAPISTWKRRAISKSARAILNAKPGVVTPKSAAALVRPCGSVSSAMRVEASAKRRPNQIFRMCCTKSGCKKQTNKRNKNNASEREKQRVSE